MKNISYKQKYIDPLSFQVHHFKFKKFHPPAPHNVKQFLYEKWGYIPPNHTHICHTIPPPLMGHLMARALRQKPIIQLYLKYKLCIREMVCVVMSGGSKAIFLSVYYLYSPSVIAVPCVRGV
jgi:hypothetical protein